MTFDQALERALDPARQAPSANRRVCPVPLQNYGELAAHLASADVSRIPEVAPSLPTSPDAPATGTFALQSRSSSILCTALVYATLDGVETRQRLLLQQNGFSNRLFEIESKRVHVDVDNPALLTQAKLLRARTRLESVALQIAERKARAALSSLTGLPPEQVDPVPNSMPPLPDPPSTDSENKETLQELLAARDIVQLDYVAEYASRLKATQDMALAKASIGRLVAAHITEAMKLNALLQLNDEICLAKIQFLDTSGQLDDWASRRPIPEPASTANSTLLSLLIAPAIHELQAGRSQQFSAIATDSTGHARDVSAEAQWNCSTDTRAVLSTTGLLTGLAPGPVTLKLEFHGFKQARTLTVIEPPADEYLPALRHPNPQRATE